MPRNRQLTSREIGLIDGLRKCGKNPTEIAAEINRSRGAVRNWIKKLDEGVFEASQRSGRPRKTTSREDRFLRVAALRDRRQSARQLGSQLSAATGKAVSKWTVSRRLSEKGIRARRPRKKPQLTARHRGLRRGWAASHRGWTLDQWKRVLFSDESKISLGSDGKTFVWRRAGEENASCCTVPTVQYPISVMVWGCMAASGVGSLHRIDGRLNADGYKNILQTKMLPDAARLIGNRFVFQQDNASIHTARTVRQWFLNNDVTVLDWPPRSPDANPIENLWHQLKTSVSAAQPKTSDELWAALQTAWESIPQENVKKLVESLPRQVQAIAKAKGGSTKY